jgi:hypothetical protein
VTHAPVDQLAAEQEGRRCRQCGRDLAGFRANTLYCSGRCQKRHARRSEGDLTRTSPPEAPKRPKNKWPRFTVVAGQLSGMQLYCASVSDRDPSSGRSAYEETEDRNRRALEAAA